MAVIAITAVEDRLQANVRTTLDMLRSANIRTWMLTGQPLRPSPSPPLAFASHARYICYR